MVYWGLTPQQQPGSYRGDDDDDDNDDEISVSLVEETGVPGEKPPNYGKLSHNTATISLSGRMYDIIIECAAFNDRDFTRFPLYMTFLRLSSQK